VLERRDLQRATCGLGDHTGGAGRADHRNVRWSRAARCAEVFAQQALTRLASLGTLSRFGRGGGAPFGSVESASMTSRTTSLAEPGAAIGYAAPLTRLRRRMAEGHALPVLTVLFAILVLWYLAA